MRRLFCAGLALALFAALPLASNAQTPPPAVPNLAEGDFVMKDFAFRDGKTLPEVKVHYYTFGTPQKDASGKITNAVLMLHGTTGTGRNALAPNFVNNLYQPGQSLDATKFFIVAPDGIGRGGSSKPSDGLRAKFPRYGYNDIVTSQHKLLTEHLGIQHLKLVIGTSMGGMQTFLWGERYPEMMDGLVTVAAEPVEMAGRNYLWRRILVEAIKQDPDWQGGNYERQPRVFAQVVPLFDIMVGSPLRLKEAGADREKAAAFYDRQVEAARKSLDANDYLYWWDSSYDYNPGPDLERIKGKLLSIAFTDDLINAVDLNALETELKRVPNAKVVMMAPTEKTLGHQNLTQPQLWGPHLAEFMKGL